MAYQSSYLKHENRPYLDFLIRGRDHDNDFIYMAAGGWYLKPEIRKWIKENIEGGWQYVTEPSIRDHIYYVVKVQFYFTNPNSLILFKMRFG